MKIVLAGIVARYPYGGVTWCSLMYLLGLRDLGHEVCYIEDTGECVYDPVQNALSTDPSYGTDYIHRALEPFGLGDRWSFVNYDGAYHGASRDTVRRWCAEADLFINLSGGSWFWRDEYAAIPRKVFVDSDPVFTQLALAKGDTWYVEFFRRFDRLFTFGANIGTPACDVPTSGFTWHHTWQPVVTGLWRTDTPARRSLHDGDDLEDRELHRRRRQQGSRVRPLHRSCRHARQAASSWRSTGRSGSCRSTAGPRWTRWGYRGRCGTIATSSSARGPSSAWPSTPTSQIARAGSAIAPSATWRRAGRRVVQDTGWSSHLPTGTGLIGFSSPEEAIDGLARIERDYAVHARRADEIAREHFDAARVLPPFLEIACG